MAKSRLYREILDLGREDIIKLPEIAETCRRAGLIAHEPDGSNVFLAALLDLLQRGSIKSLLSTGRTPTLRVARGGADRRRRDPRGCDVL